MDADLSFPLKREPMSGLEWAEWMGRCLEAYQGMFLDLFKVRWLAEDLAEDRKMRFGLQFKDKKARDSIMLSAGDYAIHLLWNKTKIVYDVDPTIQESLADMETGDVLPGDLLRQLPHPNPMFVWPAGYETVGHDGSPAIVRAMYVTGRNAAKGMCSTHAEEATEFQVTVVSDLLNKDGLVETTDSVRMSIPLGAGTTTMGKIIDGLMRNFAWEPLLPQVGTTESKRAYMRSLMKFAVAHLMYACSDKADLADPVPSRTVAKGKNQGQPTKGATLSVPLGWRIGPAIRGAMQRMERSYGPVGVSGGSTRPHIRKAHMHRFRHGVGRMLIKAKWLPPIFVGSNGEQFLADGTVIPVKG